MVKIIVTMAKKRLMAARTFKAECLAGLDWVAETGERVVVTKRGRPVAEVVPVTSRATRPCVAALLQTAISSRPVLGNWGLNR